MKSYVHRVGRTARAGRQGTSYTLLSEREVGYFKRSMAKAGKTWRAASLPSLREGLQSVQGLYDRSLEALPRVLEMERAGTLRPGGLLPPELTSVVELASVAELSSERRGADGRDAEGQQTKESQPERGDGAARGEGPRVPKRAEDGLEVEGSAVASRLNLSRAGEQELPPVHHQGGYGWKRGGSSETQLHRLLRARIEARIAASRQTLRREEMDGAPTFEGERGEQ
jgi:superfamily II DNA/RNA helicase